MQCPSEWNKRSLRLLIIKPIFYIRKDFVQKQHKAFIKDNFIKLYAWSDLNRTLDKRKLTWDDLLNRYVQSCYFIM
jgi:hypothetical protein